jgi:predicted RNA-binding protein with RPS1 domain
MLTVGKSYKGRIAKIQPTFAVVEFEGRRGIVHISEISDYLVKDIKKYLEIGQEYNFKLLTADEVANKYSLSYKALNPKLLKIRTMIIPTHTGVDNLLKDLNRRLEKKSN